MCQRLLILHFRRDQERLTEKKIEVEQLKREVALERRPISESYNQLISYILDNQNSDYLVVLDKNKDNPYQEKSKFPCKLL